jgi:hypothetical protein
MSGAPDWLPDLDLGDHPEGVWNVPLELVLAAPTSSVMKGLVRRRLETQDWAHPTARVFMRGKRLFAEVFYGPHRNSVLYPLDVYAVENSLA